jgi:hypothetical protein
VEPKAGSGRHGEKDVLYSSLGGRSWQRRPCGWRKSEATNLAVHSGCITTWGRGGAGALAGRGSGDEHVRGICFSLGARGFVFAGEGQGLKGLVCAVDANREGSRDCSSA